MVKFNKPSSKQVKIPKLSEIPLLSKFFAALKYNFPSTMTVAIVENTFEAEYTT